LDAKKREKTLSSLSLVVPLLLHVFEKKEESREKRETREKDAGDEGVF